MIKCYVPNGIQNNNICWQPWSQTAHVFICFSATPVYLHVSNVLRPFRHLTYSCTIQIYSLDQLKNARG